MKKGLSILGVVLLVIIMVGCSSHFTSASIYEYLPTPTPSIDKGKLVVLDGWSYGTSGRWSEIRGSVENVGDVPINYFEVHAEYKDANGNILDTDWTNSGELIKPGSEKMFLISHVNDPRFVKVSLYITWSVY